MQEIAAEYDARAANVESLQKRIDESVSAAFSAQEDMLEGRDLLASMARSEYRLGAQESLLSLILDSRSFDDLVRNVMYAQSILNFQAAEVAAQKERSERFAAVTDQLNAEKDEQARALAQLSETKAEAEQVVADAAAKLAGAQEEEAARLAALQAAADSMNSDAAGQGAGISEEANTTQREEVVPETTPVQPDPDPTPPSEEQSNVGWASGVASAYGGSTDPYTPNPGTTATGAVCDDSSMGVAVPMSWPNYRSLLGRTVEISYNGMTVYATVNDCGYMGGGSRVLDLQPGVWKAFGFSSCYDWGLRTVSYRFL